VRVPQGLQQPFQFGAFTDIAIGAAGCRRWNMRKQEVQEYGRRLFSCAAGRQLSIDLRKTLKFF